MTKTKFLDLGATDKRLLLSLYKAAQALTEVQELNTLDLKGHNAIAESHNKVTDQFDRRLRELDADQTDALKVCKAAAEGTKMLATKKVTR